MTDWTNTPYAVAVRDGINAAGFDTALFPDDINAILNGLDAAGLLLTPERLNAIAETIEGRTYDMETPGARFGMQAAAAIVRHSMPAVTT